MAMTFQLKDFDGPLDLLLFLINKEKNRHQGYFRQPDYRPVY